MAKAQVDKGRMLDSIAKETERAVLGNIMHQWPLPIDKAGSPDKEKQSDSQTREINVGRCYWMKRKYLKDGRSAFMKWSL